MNKKSKKIISFLLSFCMIFVLISTNVLASDAPLDQEIYLQTTETLSPYVKQDNDGKLYLDIDAQSANVDETYYDAIKSNMDMVNSMIEKGYLSSDSNGNISITNEYIQVSEENVATLFEDERSVSSKDDMEYIVKSEGNTLVVESYDRTTNSFTGYNGIIWTWYGFDLYLDTYNSTIVANSDGIGAVVLGACIPDPTISKFVDVALAIYAGTINICNRYGTGVIISCGFTWAPLTCIPYWISSQ